VPAIGPCELYFDDLSVIYLQTVGVLDKLKAAGLNAFITEAKEKEANQLLGMESLQSSEMDIIETIRRTLCEGLSKGNIRALRSSSAEQAIDGMLPPTFGILNIDEPLEALVIDDRLVNRHQTMATEKRQTPILTTYDLLNDLFERKIINQASPNNSAEVGGCGASR